MAFNRMMSELDATRAKLALFTVIILLAVDTVNPIKIFMHVFPIVQPWHIASICVVVCLYIFISEMKELLYFAVKVFFHSILSIFFREVDVIGLDNIPKYGPVIFTGNHANQFIDGVTILATCQHKISYLVADKSWKRKVVGNIAWAMGAVPVKRAQDAASKGTGVITISRAAEAGSNSIVKGEGTMFLTEVGKGDKLRLSGTAAGLKIMNILSDSEVEIETTEDVANVSEPIAFDILKRVDLSEVYAKVLDKLASGGCIGIFPEGGSHDRTDLLPLKVGVALIAYSALEKDDLNVPIVPVGLNYFRAHRFRGRAIVEYGRPTYISPSTLDAFKKGGAERREVCNELLMRIEEAMRSVLVTTPDFQSLQMIYTARRLYQRKEPTTLKKQDLNRRFAEGYKELLLRAGGNPPKEWTDIQERLLAYQKELDELGIRDRHVRRLAHETYDIEEDAGDIVLREMKVPSQLLHLIVTFLLAMVPMLTLNLPVGFIARIYAEKRRKKALEASRVKIRAHDVMLSEKVILCIVLVPTLWIIYGFVFYFCTDLDGPSIALAVISLPLFSYYGIMTAEVGMINLRDIRPYFMRLFPKNRKRLAALPEIRQKLQADLRSLVKELGPSLGEIYFKKDLNWKELQLKKRMASATQASSADDKSHEKEE
mmetsp:Transcript_27083/g.42048  ORF Transcript_27083/g.42048 Transcript_27083/m.42048 type:complete len:656 (-) Transcript_27083:398-2365(-)|eukprot:CAMPEP_0196813900 /NCGR_PEP_ID=MMETSP1362-20130617/39984_1 /TAXON_ID=163516 /ORGANISM="Leptocylindrus danicus, Strain CCMP1856" /LENGTH=655 /DNA_ID=CAMNT_0042190329 /DNA_START=101 /DNA_END=2068 /DNA_ORIENTATION=-